MLIRNGDSVRKAGLVAFALCICTGVAAGWSVPEKLKWWQTGIVYQVYPRSFKDSNGDGVGDIPGITSQLSYLKDVLGVSAVWLSPIYPSPQADFGYDISNFTDVDPTYGSLNDFDQFVTKSHRLGLKVVLDLVPNHSSDEHPWFIKSADPSHPEHAKYRDWYVWADPKGSDGGKPKPPNNWLSVFRGSGWTYNEKRKQFYLHQFHYKQPDLNFRNLAVVEEMKEVIRFWMRRKVDGFRVDAAPFIFEDSRLTDEPKSPSSNDPDDHGSLLHPYTQNLDETFDMFQQWRAVVDEDNKTDRVMMAEAYADINTTMRYFGTKEKPGSHFPFNFFLITQVNQGSNATHYKQVIDTWMNQMNDFRWPNWVIGNHDQKRVATRFGPELSDSLNMLLLSLPGTAMTFNGEEIGMTDNYIRWEDTLDPQALNKGEASYLTVSRDPCRTPFQWDTTVSAGFSKNISTWLPVNPNYWKLNVQNQGEASKKTHLNTYKRMVLARQQPTLQRGDLNVTVEGQILRIERTLQNHPTFTLLINLGTRQQEWTSPNLHRLKVWASSINAGLVPGKKLKRPFIIQAKAGYLLTSGTGQMTASWLLSSLTLFILVIKYAKNIL